ncbi:MAG TPA: DNA (cytosine-5-)-methyltransferase [Streptosporangiaceae bacterium]|nr:DNA (cytosine-5-)-methyltransferase [Streptosporangiaceae bacterium]
MTTRSGHYGVKLVRGPFVRLAPHPEACADEEAFLAYAARLRAEGAPLAADLFSGGGGLSLGLEAAGYRVVLSADHDVEAVETHRHHFGGLALDWDLSEAGHVAEIARLVSAAGVELLAGGPPCQPFSKAGRSKIRHRVRHGLRDPRDERKDLWRSFLEVIQLALPPAVIMENVPDMALDREMFILRTMVHELETLGYTVEERVVDTWRYGVPQFRQRLILVGMRDGVAFRWPEETPDKITVWNAIGDLPEVEGGWRPEGGADGWADYGKPVTSFQRLMREGMDGVDAARVFDHITRPVREDDERAFQLMDPKTRYSDLPADMRRYRHDIFDDKYKKLDENDLSRTITAHIAKDGYWYIHPRQNRTLTVREAARLQTFPDRFRFAGPPSAAFRQIGNAVPPAVGEQLGRAIRASMDSPVSAGPSTQEVAGLLAAWYRSLPVRVVPWLQARTRWQAIAAEILLERVTFQQARSLWPLLARWDTPRATLAAESELREIGKWLGRDGRAERILEAAGHLACVPEQLDDDDAVRRIPGVYEAVADLAVLAVATGAEDSSEEPVLPGRGVLRAVARFTGEHVDRRNRLTDGRLGVARMIGYGSDARDAHLGLVELAAAVCRPAEPACVKCPLAELCHSSQVAAQRESLLF